MHFHHIFECKFALLCERFLHIFLLNFDRIFDDLHDFLGRGGTSEACGATSWQPGGSKSDFLMNFGGSRLSFWSPGGTLGGVMGPLVNPKRLQDASPKLQNSKKLSSETISNQSHQKMKLRIWFLNDFLMFFVWRLSVFLKRLVTTLGINTQEQNTHFVLVFTMFYVHRAFEHH